MVRNSLKINCILDQVYLWSKNQDFKGYNKHDGLNSPFLNLLFGWSKWPRIIAIQSVMRAPVNIRPLLGINKTINPKGIALFCIGLLDRYKATNNSKMLAEAEKLLNLLMEIKSDQEKWSGMCWGYPYPWQDLGFFALPHTPNAVVTSFVCEAFLQAYRITGNQDYLDTVRSSIKFFLADLTVIEETQGCLCLGYMPLPMTMKVMDVSILIGAILSQFSMLDQDNSHVDIARKLVGFVVSKQTDYGAWYYTDPPGDSLIGHDNYHTGFILDALWRYMETNDDWAWKKNYEKGLEFYANNLFNNDGSPRWMSNKKYPYDIHGSAQGLISFSLAVKNGYNYQGVLGKVLNWSIENMYNDNGRFYYQKRSLYTKKFTLLRWCNAWMFRGISSLPVNFGNA